MSFAFGELIASDRGSGVVEKSYRRMIVPGALAPHAVDIAQNPFSTTARRVSCLQESLRLEFGGAMRIRIVPVVTFLAAAASAVSLVVPAHATPFGASAYARESFASTPVIQGGDLVNAASASAGGALGSASAFASLASGQLSALAIGGGGGSKGEASFWDELTFIFGPGVGTSQTVHVDLRVLGFIDDPSACDCNVNAGATMSLANSGIGVMEDSWGRFGGFHSTGLNPYAPINSEGTIGFTLVPFMVVDPAHPTVSVRAFLAAGANEGAADFIHTAQVALDLPPGIIGFTSASGVFLTEGGRVPEPPAILLLGAALMMMRLAARHRLGLGKVSNS